MMNLELLEMASKLSGDKSYAKVAAAHANTTLKNHFRADNSSYHVVIYDEETGAVRQKKTHQGFSDESLWSRGQSWGLYGYTMMYRYTHNARYLKQARAIAGLLIPLLPADGVPYWDFCAPNIPDEPRDASAAAIMASALLELSGYVRGEEAAMYRSAALHQIRSLASGAYLCAPGECHGFILKHSTGHFMGNGEVDKPLSYADYYFLEALTRAL